MPREFDH